MMAREFDAPQSRIEAILQNMLGAKNEILPPFSNNERILLNIWGMPGVEILPIQSRIENLLMNWLGEEKPYLPPMSNNERILLNIIGEAGIEILPGDSRVETLLKEILTQGSISPYEDAQENENEEMVEGEEEKNE